MKDKIKLRNIFYGIWKYFLSGLIMFVVVKNLNIYLKFNFLTFIFEVVIGIVIYVICLIVFRAKILDQLTNLTNKVKIQ